MLLVAFNAHATSSIFTSGVPSTRHQCQLPMACHLNTTNRIFETPPVRLFLLVEWSEGSEMRLERGAGVVSGYINRRVRFMMDFVHLEQCHELGALVGCLGRW